MLCFVEAHHAHLGEQEPKSLTTLVEHLAQGDLWEWYALEERPPGGALIAHGELGTFRRLKVASDVGGLPRTPGRWRVAAVESPPDPRVSAKLVIEPTTQTA
jgi:hypothetical protein